MNSTCGHWPLSRAEHWEMDQQGHIKHSSSGLKYHFDNADNAVDDIQVMAMIKFCYRPLPRWRRTVQCTLPPPGRTVHLHWCYLAGSYCFFFANMADHLLIKSFWWSSCHILWIGHTPPQKWDIVGKTIVNRHSGRCLDIAWDFFTFLST